MEYTLQRELDQMGFGGRWGCVATLPINICENEMNRKLYDAELERVIGRWFRTGTVIMANYKNHDYAVIPANPPGGWGPEADPEWHYWVINHRGALLEVMALLGIEDLKFEYDEVIINGPEGNHHMLQILGGEQVNPDPALHGPIIEVRRIKV